nr:uncharacterized protein LOC108059858 [Drosophila takahashii]
MRNNKADNTQRQKLGLERKRQRRRRVWGLTLVVEILAAIRRKIAQKKLANKSDKFKA